MIPQEYLAIYLGANAFALGVLALAFWRRGAARWVGVGVFAWAAVANTTTALRQPHDYLNYAALTPSAWYRDFIVGWFSLYVTPVVVSIAAGQIVIAALLASRRSLHRWIGAAGAWVFLIAISPLGIGSGFPFSLTFGVALLVSLQTGDVTSPVFRVVIHWLPRTLGLALAAFMGLLALDAFVAEDSTLDTVRGVALHLVPACIVLAIVLVGLRWERTAGALFFALAVGYGFLADGRVSWMLAISAPLVVEGVFFLWSGRLGRTLPARRMGARTEGGGNSLIGPEDRAGRQR